MERVETERSVVWCTVASPRCWGQLQAQPLAGTGFVCPECQHIQIGSGLSRPHTHSGFARCYWVLLFTSLLVDRAGMSSDLAGPASSPPPSCSLAQSRLPTWLCHTSHPHTWTRPATHSAAPYTSSSHPARASSIAHVPPGDRRALFLIHLELLVHYPVTGNYL